MCVFKLYSFKYYIKHFLQVWSCELLQEELSSKWDVAHLGFSSEITQKKSETNAESLRFCQMVSSSKRCSLTFLMVLLDCLRALEPLSGLSAGSSFGDVDVCAWEASVVLDPVPA